jgi:hypothetical protein
MFEMIGLDHPVRLIVGGLHGSEGVKTEPILKEVSRNVEKGSLILCNLSRRVRYISTINKAYYSTTIGIRLLNLIRRYRPEIYIELHSYSKKAYPKLTDPFRKEKKGVPPLIELEDGILLGSVSPHIRASEFRKNDLCITLDLPFELKNTIKILQILNTSIASQDRLELLEKLREKYPLQVLLAERRYYEFLMDIY